MKTILFLEDDPDQSETIMKQLTAAFPQYSVIDCVTESELREKANNIAPGELKFAVLDAMAPWAVPAEDMPFPPKEVQTGGVRYAGRRCLGYLRKRFGAEVPVWVYSVLSRELAGIEETDRTFFLEKQPEHGELIRAIQAGVNL